MLAELNIKKRIYLGLKDIYEILRKENQELSLTDILKMNRFEVRDKVERLFKIQNPEIFYGIESFIFNEHRKSFTEQEIEWIEINLIYKKVKSRNLEQITERQLTPISIVFEKLNPRIKNPILAINGDVSIHEFMEILGGSVDNILQYRNIGQKVAFHQIKQILDQWGYE